MQGRKLYCVPDGLRKSAAADTGLRPAHGELHDAGSSADHVLVTTASGVLAGEEIVSVLLDIVSGRPDT